MDNLYSAVPTEASPLLSEQDFQMLLSTWLNEKGILSELRSQLRFKMVNALKGTVVGKNVNKDNLNGRSLCTQAINTVVAEYLIQNKCYYSLSVFNTEVSFSHLLPGFSINKTMKEYYLDKESILNIMELIGVIKTSIYCEEIATLYFNKQEYSSLLYCIISVLGKLTNKTNCLYNLQLDKSSLDLHVENNFMKQIQNLLSLTGIDDKSLQTLMENIIILYNTEKKGKEEEFSQLVNQLKSDFNDEKKQMKKVIKYNQILKRQLMKITKDYKKLKLNSKKLVVGEQFTKRNYLQERIDNNDLSSHLKRENLISSEGTKSQHNVMCQLQHCSELCKYNKMINGDLIKQNKNLTQENEQQRELIDKLTFKYKQLVCEFTECQQKVALFHSNLSQDHSQELLTNVLYGNILDLPAHLTKRSDSCEENASKHNNVREEIVHETRLRLKQLEKETNTIEEKCKLLHLNNVV